MSKCYVSAEDYRQHFAGESRAEFERDRLGQTGDDLAARSRIETGLESPPELRVGLADRRGMIADRRAPRSYGRRGAVADRRRS